MDIQKLLSQPENRKLEFKREFPKKSNLLKTIVAFANGAGGNLIIGVSDTRREISDVKEPLELEEKIANLIYDSISPLISPYISIHNIDGKSILNVQILSGSNKPYYLKKAGPKDGVFVRLGSTTRKAGSDMIQELTRQRLGYSFEEEIIPALFPDDLDLQAVNYFLDALKEKSPINDILTRWHILKKNNGDYLPTVLAAALFGKETLTQFDYMNIRLTRFNDLTYNDIAESKEFTIPLLLRLEEIIYRSVIGLKNRCRYNCQNEVVKQQTTSIPVYLPLNRG